MLDLDRIGSQTMFCNPKSARSQPIAGDVDQMVRGGFTPRRRLYVINFATNVTPLPEAGRRSPQPAASIRLSVLPMAVSKNDGRVARATTDRDGAAYRPEATAGTSAAPAPGRHHAGVCAWRGSRRDPRRRANRRPCSSRWLALMCLDMCSCRHAETCRGRGKRMLVVKQRAMAGKLTCVVAGCRQLDVLLVIKTLTHAHMLLPAYQSVTPALYRSLGGQPPRTRPLTAFTHRPPT